MRAVQIDTARLAKLHQMGWTTKRIAQTFGVSEQTISRRLAGLGYKTSKRR